MSNPIRFFSKKDTFAALSNFAPFGFEEQGHQWHTVEHYFQAQKFTDPQHRERIRNSQTPMAAKALGQSRKFPIRPDWDQVKESVMMHALRQKFQNPSLRKLLLETKNRELIEDSPHDRFWGCGRDGKGKNRLGQLLMVLRGELREAV